jgi:hypothetical protein
LQPSTEHWAPKLHELGLERFRGLIDRDSGNAGDRIVKVLSRYSVENYLYDPLTMCAFMIHRGVTSIFPGLNVERVSAVEILTFERQRLQGMVNQFCNWLATETSQNAIVADPKIQLAYVGVHSIDISAWWIDTKGHDLERLLQSVMNPLGAQLQRGALLRADRSEIVSFQTKTIPELLSQDLVAIFDNLRTST